MRIRPKRRNDNRRALLEQLEQRHLLAASPFGTNPLQALDVSRDGTVSSLDALRVINAVARDQDGDGIANPADNLGNFIDVTGDGGGTPLDALRVINALGRGLPIIAATLPNDSGPAGRDELALDLRTNDYAIDLNVSVADLGNNSVAFSLGSMPSATVDITDRFSDGRVVFTQEQIDDLFGGPLSDGDHPFEVSLGGGGSRIEFVLTVDRSAPDLTLVTPLEAGDHSATARIIGAINDDNVGGPVTVAVDDQPARTLAVDESGQLDDRIASGLASGSHRLMFEATDAVGNTAVKQVEFSVSDEFLVGADDSEGWGVRSSTAILLGEQDSFVVESEMPIDLGPQGNRTLSFDVLPQFDTSDTTSAFDDLFLVYLVDSTDPTRTLLDGGESGTPLFSLNAMGQSDYLPGLVRFNGTRLDVDLSGLPQSDGVLRFQMIGGDQDTGSFVQVSNLTNEVDPAGSVQSLFPIQVPRSAAGDALQLGGLNPNENIEVVLGLPALDTSTGKYSADLRVRSDQGIESRQVAGVLRGLPDGVQLEDVSGVDGEGNPYISFANAIGPSGLAAGVLSNPVRVTFDNPDLLRLPIDIAALVGQPNQPPTLEAIQPLSLIPGDVVSIALEATDPDGDTITYAVSPGEEMPTTTLLPDGTLVIAPTPDQVGTYEFTVNASDGAAKTRQTVSVTVTADPLTSTRVKGQILDVDGTPLQGMMIELGGVQGVTDTEGMFTLDAGSGPLVSDTLRIRGDTFTGSNTYPFIAEKLPLVLEHEVFEGSLNTIHRPIYLPKLDVAGGTTIDPTVETTVTQEIAPGEMATVTVAASSLMNQQGTPFEGTLSITEVPPDFTPAALPENLMPGVVVTIQPGEMVFASPAPLTLPNRAEWAPGTAMNLWSINPTTGDFEIVGAMVVSADGQRIETVGGGIRNSSWHFAGPPPPPEVDDDPPLGPPEGCPEGKSGGNGPGGGDGPSKCPTGEFASRVNFLSGAVVETHDLVSYQSLGTERGVTLVYDSLEADPRPIVPFGYDNVQVGQRSGMFGSVTVTDGTTTESVRGIWRTTTSDANGAVQVDLSEWPSGQVPYSLRIGLGQLRGSDPGDRLFTGTTESFNRSLAHVNRINSPFGAGWTLSGLQEIVDNADGSALLINGNNTASLFSPPETEGGPYQSPAGDFSALTKDDAGQFVRTFPDQSESRFNADHLLAEYEDRQGRVSSYDYDDNGRLITITDPVGLQTTFQYAAEKITITDPANRVTELELDDSGNLVKITDPDQTSRRFDYDARHHMVGETDQRGKTETTLYDQYGRATQAIRKDGSVRRVSPAQTQVEISQGESSFQDFNLLINGGTPTFRPLNAQVRDSVSSQFVDANGNVEVSGLNPIGLPTQVTDGEGVVGSTTYNDDNLPSIISDGRGDSQFLRYDDRGNVVETKDDLTGPVSFWIGNGRGNWHDAANWSEGVVPDENTDVVIDQPGVHQLDIRDDISVRSLEIGSPRSQITINVSDNRVTESELRVSEPSRLASGSTINVFGQARIDGPFRNEGRVKVIVDNAFGNSFFKSSVLSLGTASQFDNQGVIQLDRQEDILGSRFESRLAIENGPLLNPPVGTIESLTINGSLEAADLVNQGTIRVENGGSLFLSGAISNVGTIEAVSGNIKFGGKGPNGNVRSATLQNAGLIDLAGGSLTVSEFAGLQQTTLTNDGVIMAPGENRFRVTGGATFNPSTGRFTHAAIYQDSSFGGGILGTGTNQDTISVYGSITVSGDFTNSPSGIIRVIGGGIFGLRSSALLTIADPSQFNNRGTIQLTSDTSDRRFRQARVRVVEGTLVNGPEGLVEILPGEGVVAQLEAPFLNQGTIQLNGGLLEVPQHLTNSGTIEIGGSINVSGTLDNTGLIDVQSVLNVSGDSAELTNDGVIMAPGENHFLITDRATFHPSTGRFTHAAIYQNPGFFGGGGILGTGTNQDAISLYGPNTAVGEFTNAPSGTLRHYWNEKFWNQE